MSKCANSLCQSQTKENEDFCGGNYCKFTLNWYEATLEETREFLKHSQPGAKRVCLERIQTALIEFIEYRKRKEKEKEENANRTS